MGDDAKRIAFRASSRAGKTKGQSHKTLPGRLATRGGAPVALPQSRILRAGRGNCTIRSNCSVIVVLHKTRTHQGFNGSNSVI